MREQTELAFERLKVKLNPNPKREGWAEHMFKAGLRHEKAHPDCVRAQKEREEASNENLLKRIRELECLLG